MEDLLQNWDTLFEARDGLSRVHVEILSSLMTRSWTTEELANMLLQRKQALTRMVNNLAKKKLVMFDVVGTRSEYLVRITSEGEAWVRKNNVPF